MVWLVINFIDNDVVDGCGDSGQVIMMMITILKKVMMMVKAQRKTKTMAYTNFDQKVSRRNL